MKDKKTTIQLTEPPKKGDVLSIRIPSCGETFEYTLKVRKNSSKKSIAKAFNKLLKKDNAPVRFLST